jgi:hypothetical protein
MRSFHFFISIVIVFLNPLATSLSPQISPLVYALSLVILAFFGLSLYRNLLKIKTIFGFFLLLLLSLTFSTIYQTPFLIDSLIAPIIFVSGFLVFACCGFFVSFYISNSKFTKLFFHTTFIISILNYIISTKETLSVQSFFSASVNRWSSEIADPTVLSDLVTPNSISLVSLAFIFLVYSFKIRGLIPSSFIISYVYPLISTFLIYSLSSRLFLVLSLFLYYWINLHELFFGKYRIFFLILLSCSLGIVFLLESTSVIDSIYNIFSLADSSRGVESGFSGRTDIWAYALNFFPAIDDLSFYLGSGLLSARKVGFSFDNVIIGHLYELGFFGITAYLLFLSFPFLINLKNLDNGIAHNEKTFISLYVFVKFMRLLSIIYFVIGFFEYRGLSVSNPLSAVFSIFMFALLIDFSRFKSHRLRHSTIHLLASSD